MNRASADARERRLNMWCTAGWLLSVLPITLLSLHGLAIVPLAWSEQAMTGMQTVATHSYATPLKTLWMSSDLVGESPAIVLEDGRPLQCPDAYSGDIVTTGQGRFRLESGWLFLSASDNSDPRSNGRQYVLRWPTQPDRALVIFAQVLALAGTLVVVVLRRRPIVAALRSPSLIWCSVLVVAIVAVHRWWFFAEVRVPSIQPDSASYYLLAQAIGSGEWPHFEIRPPAYPVFLKGALAATRSVYGVLVLQTLVTVASALVMVAGVHRLKPALAPGAALGMAVFITGLWHIEHDTSILSETIYVNCIVLGFGFLILALASGRKWHFATASGVLGLTILTRPAGLFLVAPFLLAVAFLTWNRRPLKQILSFAIPLPVLLFLLASYNYFNAGVFAVTAWGEANLAVASFTMWDTRPEYPEEINAGIREVRAMIQERLTDDERAALASSWDPERLAPIFLKGFYQPALNRAFKLSGDYIDSRRWIRRVSIDSIRAQPTTYAKFVSTMAHLFYLRNPTYHLDHAVFLNQRVRAIYGVSPEQPGIVRSELLQHLHQPRPSVFQASQGCERTNDPPPIVPTLGRRLHRLVQVYRDRWFGQPEWTYAFGIVLALAVVRLLFSRGRHLGAFVLTVIGASAVAAGLIVCLVEYAGHRYSYPTEFVYYVTVALVPLLWVDLDRTRPVAG